MTPPHDDCCEVHKIVAKVFQDIGYDVSVVERFPSDNCGDRTSRQRWILIARLKPSGPLDMLAFADKGPTAIKDVLDPACDVDDDLWVDTDVEQARGGAVSQLVTNVGQKTYAGH